MGRGTFLVVEGPDGAGKSTLVRWLVGQLTEAGREVVAVREPGGTPVAEAVRAVALGLPPRTPAPVELFLMLAARADLVARVVAPALAAGRVVVADRFDLSTLAYQVAGGRLPREEVEMANRLAVNGIAPDLTLVLDVPISIGRARQRGRTIRDRFERRGTAFQGRVVAAYRAARGAGVVHIDASRPRDAVREAAWRAVARATALSLRGAL